MSVELTIGLILLTGFIFAEILKRLGFPKVTGYILAGVFLNPQLFGILPPDFSKNTDIVVNIALAFITFSVGGTLQWDSIKKSGRSLLFITVFEAETAFLLVAVSFFVVSHYFLHLPLFGSMAASAAFALLIAIFASPTDPSATLAVIEEYKTKGPVSRMVMGVAAFDDTVGILNFSVFTAIAIAIMGGSGRGWEHAVLMPLYAIFGAVALGIFLGLALNLVNKVLVKESEGTLFVVVTSFIVFSFGLAQLIHVDMLLTAMSFGAFVVNFNPLQKKIFFILENYTIELIFLLFFTVSATSLDFHVLATSWPLIIVFVIFRALGKYSGTYMGGHFTNTSGEVKKYTAFGLLPQGGIVIGMSLMIKNMDGIGVFSDMIISIVIGATIIHEILGPLSSKYGLLKAGEISKSTK